MTAPNNPLSRHKRLLIGAGVTSGCLIIGLIPLGIFATVFLPSLSPQQFPRTKEAEARQYLTKVLAKQQAHFKATQQFAETFEQINFPPPETPGYSYSLTVPKGHQNQAIAIVQATPTKTTSLRTYIAVSRAVGQSSKLETLICHTPTATSPTAFTVPTTSTNPLKCPPRMRPLRE
jgi:type II secretory pathway pseudopilin PulG